MELETPEFIGHHEVWFTNGVSATLTLIGATCNEDGKVFYLHDVDGNVYNYDNVLMTKKV